MAINDYATQRESDKGLQFQSIHPQCQKSYRPKWRRIIANGNQTTNNGVCLEFQLAAAITQLYQAEDIDARIKEALGQAMQYYGQMLAQRQQQIGGYDLAKYKFIQNRQ
ncbi:MAG: hypothetical protein EZS28_040096 [Streblomastix strix]|uniref:Uncharacterized protein n=1 Tax=Streblomastix strix TaxID=222440 RepID=A0A5J4U1E3_9EUKA|nr:MAG: hypothetical protein EZS28_040096 [Streblomastix strix]